MAAEDLARLVVYTLVALPAILFVGIYVWLLFFAKPRLRMTLEAVHMIAFTAVIAYIAVDFLVAIALGWWDFSLPRFLTVLGFASFFLWQRVALLWKYNIFPRIQKRRMARRARKAAAEKAAVGAVD